MTTLKILLIEDRPEDAELIQHELRKAGIAFTAVRVDNEADFRRELKPELDVILADFKLPQFDALRAHSILQQSGLDIPFIIVSGSIGEERAVHAMKSGITDYLLKDRLARLSQAMANAIETRRLRQERRRTEEQLRLQSAARHAAANAVMITRVDGSILWVNPAFETLTGYPAGEVLGRNPRLLKSGRQDAAFYRDMTLTIESGRVWRGEIVNRRKDGTEYTEEKTIAPVRGADGAISHFVAIKQDVTPRKELERQLFQAQKLEGIGSLAGGIAHDFNNLLVAILGFADLALAEGDQVERIRVDLGEIRKAAERAAALTKQLLAFSRKQVFELKIMDLNTLVANLLDMLRRLLGEDVELETRLAPGLGRVKADPNQVEQIVMNLVVNARDAMPDGGHVQITTSEVRLDRAAAARLPGARPGRFACLAVSDTGTGIPPEVLDRIFEPFFTTKEDGKGTGLGLAVVYGIVHQHEGFIQVESEIGRGSTFRIFLPVYSTEPSETAVAGHAFQTGTAAGAGRRVLVVEDDDTTRRLACRLLNSVGYHATEAVDGPEAAAIFKREGGKFDLLFCDAVLPRQNGLELAEELVASQPGLAILLTSGYLDDRECLARIREKGWRLLPKPYTPNDLLAHLAEVWRQRQESA